MRILGVELGTWSLKAVEMESRFRRIDILDFHEVRLPLQIMDPTAVYKQAMNQLMARLPSHPEKIVTSVPPAQTALRFLPLPIKQRKQVEKTFRFELEDNIPFKLDDAIIEHHVTRTKDGSLVFAAIAPKRHIQSHIEWLKAVGLDPDWLTFDGMGVVNLYLAGFSADRDDRPEGPVMVLDIGHLKTNISIFDQDRLQFFRSIAWGGAALTSAISITLGCSIEEAERFKMNDLKLDDEGAKASAETRELLFAAGEAFSPFTADINHSLVAYRNLYKQELKAVYLTGGTSKAWGIQNFLGRALNVPVSPLRTFAGVNVKEDIKNADESRFAEPLGRAVVFSRKVPFLFNFRQQEVAKETSLTEVSTFLRDENVLRLLKFAGIMAVILFLHVTIAGILAEREAKVATDELRKVFGQTFPAVPAKLRTMLTESPKELKKYIDQKNSELDQKLKMISKTRVPMMGLLRDVSDTFPADLKVDVNLLQLDDRTFQMEGVLYSGDLNRVTEGLKKLSSLNNISLQRDGQRFTYRGEVVGR